MNGFCYTQKAPMGEIILQKGNQKKWKKIVLMPQTQIHEVDSEMKMVQNRGITWRSENTRGSEGKKIDLEMITSKTGPTKPQETAEAGFHNAVSTRTCTGRGYDT